MKQEYSLMSGIKVVELDAYLPVSFLGKMLKDFGADVLLIKQIKENTIMRALEELHDGKTKIKLNLKNQTNIQIAKKIIYRSDILIEGYRPGVMEKLNLDPKDLLQMNPALIIIRVTGYGQNGKYSNQPGHEINYLSLSGILSSYTNPQGDIVNPQIIMGDLFCGALIPMYHLSQALLNRKLTGRGCIINSGITDNLINLNGLVRKFDQKNETIYICTVCKDNEYVLISADNEDILRNIFSIYDNGTGIEGASKEEVVKNIQNMAKGMSVIELFELFGWLKGVKLTPIVKYTQLDDFLRNVGVADEKFRVIHQFNVTSNTPRTKRDKLFNLKDTYDLDDDDFCILNENNKFNPKL